MSAQFRAVSTMLTLFLFFTFLNQANARVRSEGAQFCGFQCPISSVDQTLELLGTFQKPVPFGCGKNQSKASKTITIADGARKTMAMIYGSCQVLSLPVRGLLSPKSIPKGAISYRSHGKRYVSSRQKVIENHPYLQPRLNASCSDEKACSAGNFDSENICTQNACFVMNNPPLYQYGGKASSYSVYVRTKKMRGPGSSGIDCSGFVSQAMTIEGIRAYPNENLSSAGFGTSQFWQLGATDASGQPKDCFERVMGETGIRPGDLIVVPNNHIVMVDTVGKDPFGIEALLRKAEVNEQALENNYRSILSEKGVTRSGAKSSDEFQHLHEMTLKEVLNGKSIDSTELQMKFLNGVAEEACDQMLLDPEDYKVTIAHSSPHGGHIGVQRERLFPGVGKVSGTAPMAAAMVMKAKSDCVQALQKKWYERSKKSQSEIVSVLAESFGYIDAVKKREDSGRGARVLRHDPARPGCKADSAEIPKIPGSECVDCCSTDSSYSQMVPGNFRNSDDDVTLEENQQ